MGAPVRACRAGEKRSTHLVVPRSLLRESASEEASGTGIVERFRTSGIGC